MEIKNLKEKLNGSIPVTRSELFTLVNSWGRSFSFITDDFKSFKSQNPKECYDLSNLDVSEITDLSYIFYRSPYDGNLSKWNVSNCIDMNRMFGFSQFNNDSLKDWNVSKVIDMEYMFLHAIFNNDISKWKTSNVERLEKTFANSHFDGDISQWDLSKVNELYRMFEQNENFEKKYNNGEPLPIMTSPILEWMNQNRKKMFDLNVSDEELNDIDDYLTSFNSLNDVNSSSKRV